MGWIGVYALRRGEVISAIISANYAPRIRRLLGERVQIILCARPGRKNVARLYPQCISAIFSAISLGEYLRLPRSFISAPVTSASVSSRRSASFDSRRVRASSRSSWRIACEMGFHRRIIAEWIAWTGRVAESLAATVIIAE